MRHPLVPPRPPALSALRVLLAGPLVVLLLAACGARAEPVTGTLNEDPEGGRSHLVLQGTPRQMGFAQGRLLRARIHAFHEAWQKALLAQDGDLLSPQTRARRRDLTTLLEPARRSLPEAALQELEGLAEGSGLPLTTLLLSEMLTDFLRFQTPPGALLEGSLSLSPLDGRSPVLRLQGPLADLVRPQLLWITRPARPGGLPVTVLAWPGSLGGLVAVRSDGLVLMAVEQPLEIGRQGLAGVPFDLSLRLAAERAADARAARALLSGTTAHRVLLADLGSGHVDCTLCALAGEDQAPLEEGADGVTRAVPPPHALPRDAVVERRSDGTIWLEVEGSPGRGLRVP